MASHEVIVPVPQAGGGKPSLTSHLKQIESFSAPMLKHLKRIYAEIAVEGGQVSSSQAVNFLTEIQHQAGDEVLPHAGFAFNDFLKYAGSPAFDAMAPLMPTDLSYPLNNYFICSSHNTYLTGHQLYGQSSADGYKNVLLRGCRCIEIDVWDGESEDYPEATEQESHTHRVRDALHRSTSRVRSRHSSFSSRQKENHPESKTSAPAEEPDKLTPWRTASSTSSTKGQPRVLHGYTLTKEISFEDVCIAVRDVAFVTSDLPIIVSLEVHAGLEQQEIMVDIMSRVWKGLMVDEVRKKAEGKLPSPADLRNKILVKVKHATAVKTPDNAGHGLEKKRSTSPSTSSISSLPSSDDDNQKKHGKPKKKRSKVIEALGRLGIYTSSYHFSGFGQPEAKIPSHVFSLSESALMKQHEEDSAALFSHNRDFLMRTYPKGLRVSSSNLDPTHFWRKGVQMVALNWQKWDRGMMLNEAMFAGGGGWELKPEAYRTFSSPSKVKASVTPTYSLSIRFLAGHNLPIPPEEDNPDKFRPYIRCGLHTEKPDAIEEADLKDDESKRKTKARKGVNPDFEGESVTFGGVSSIDQLSFFRLKVVHDESFGKDDLAGWACIRLDRLRRGYRIIRLLDSAGKETEGLLLVHITSNIL